MEKNKLFIRSLPWSIDSESLRKLFSEFGEISEAVVISDRDTGRSKGYGFVTFVNEEDAKKAKELNGKEIEGRAIVVDFARPREDRDRNRDRNFRG